MNDPEIGVPGHLAHLDLLVAGVARVGVPSFEALRGGTTHPLHVELWLVPDDFHSWSNLASLGGTVPLVLDASLQLGTRPPAPLVAY